MQYDTKKKKSGERRAAPIKLRTIKEAFDRVKALTLSNGGATQVDLLLCADFNRHHELWGGAQAFGKAGRNDEAEPIIDFMQENALTSLLPVGTVTWEHYNGSTCSTIDLLLATGDLSDSCEYCGVHPTDHGSGHRAIRAHFVLDTTEHEEKRGKRMYDKADWKKIREEVSTRIADDSSLQALSSKDELEAAVESLEAAVNGVLKEHVARRTESAHLHVVSGVSSCYAVKPSALHKTRKAMSPRGSLAQSHHPTMPTSFTDKARHGR